MSMELFEKVLARQRDPGPVEKRLPKAVGTLTFAYWVGLTGAALTVLSGVLAPQLGMVEQGEKPMDVFLRSLPLAVVFLGAALYVRWGVLAQFLQARMLLPDAERQRMRMRWTPGKAIVHKYVELFAVDEEDDGTGAEAAKRAPVARAAVEKNLRRFDTRTWEAEVTVLLDPESPARGVLIDDGRFLYAGRILAKGEPAPSLFRRLVVLGGFAALVVLLAALGN